MSKNINTFVLIMLAMFIALNIHAQQSQKLILTGSVLDAENGEPLRGATISVVDTKNGAKSDLKGNFKIKNLDPGKYSLRVSYIGYQTKEITDITVSAEKNEPLKILLAVQITQTEDVLVVANRSDDNDIAMLLQRKNADQVSDGVSKEEMKKLPDSDAGQALKRVTGITLVDNKFIYVRGVSERYSNTTLNGASLTSTEPDKKAFSFDMFPSEFLENVSVAKSFTPDMPGNFAGGLVQLNTVDFPQSSSFKVSISSFGNTNSSIGTDNKFLHSPGGSTDWLAKDDGTRALPSLVPANRNELEDLKREAVSGNQEAKDKYESFSKSFNSSNWKKEEKMLSPMDNRGIAMSLSHILDIGGDQLGIIGSMNYDNSYGINNVNRNGYLGNFDTLYKFNGQVNTRSVAIGGLFNVAYKLGTNHTISFKNMFNRSIDDETLSLDGQDVGYQFLDIKSYSSQFVQKSLYTGQFGGNHNINFTESFNLITDWRVGYSHSERDEPDFRRIKFSRQIADAEFGYPYTPEVLSSPSGDGARAGRFFSYLNDEAINGGINFQIPLKIDSKPFNIINKVDFKISDIKIKFGALHETRNRDFTARSLTLTQTAFLDPEIGNLLLEPDLYNHPDKIFSSDVMKFDDGLIMSEDSKLSDSDDAQEILNAAYFMFDLGFDISDEKFKLIAGLRVEDNNQILNSFGTNNEKIEVKRPTTDFLPSLNLMWKKDENTNVRFSASQTLTRPSLREFAPFAFFDYLQQALVQGNPNLKRALIQNFDVRYEVYPTFSEVVSVGLFYKRFTNAIEETIFPQQSELTRTFANADSAIAFNYGAEFEFRKNLGFLSSSFENFMFVTNVAIIHSEITVQQGGAGTEDTRTMWGQSPYTVNVGLFYSHPEWKTTVNLGYNTYGKRIIQVGQRGVYDGDNPHVYELPRDLVDLSIVQPFESFELKLSIRDILNQKLIWEQAGRVAASNLRGTNIAFSISYKLQ